MPPAKKRGKKPTSFGNYFRAVLDKDNVQIDRDAKSQLESIIRSVGDCVALEARTLVMDNKRVTTNEADVKAAVELKFPGELHTYAKERMNRALTTFQAAQSKDKAEGVKISKSTQADLVFPPSRAHHLLKQYAPRAGVKAAVALAAALEYLAAEILRNCIKHMRNRNRKRINADVLFGAIQGDEELIALMQKIGHKVTESKPFALGEKNQEE